MTKDERDRLRELEAKATKGPWHRADTIYRFGDDGAVADKYGIAEDFRVLLTSNCNLDHEDRIANAEFCIAARNSLIPILDALDAMEKERDAARREALASRRAIEPNGVTSFFSPPERHEYIEARNRNPLPEPTT